MCNKQVLFYLQEYVNNVLKNLQDKKMRLILNCNFSSLNVKVFVVRESWK